jgi:hypothetical protein
MIPFLLPAAGTIAYMIGSEGVGKGHLRWPCGVAVDAQARAAARERSKAARARAPRESVEGRGRTPARMRANNPCSIRGLNSVHRFSHGGLSKCGRQECGESLVIIPRLQDFPLLATMTKAYSPLVTLTRTSRGEIATSFIAHRLSLPLAQAGLTESEFLPTSGRGESWSPTAATIASRWHYLCV